MSASKNKLVVIAGPTAVGKTDIAIKLAQHLSADIVSADSRQCYKEMTIGTAKPSPTELSSAKHYFIDEFSVTEHITAADFEKFALKYLDQIFETKNIAIVCGGTGLYIDALCNGLDEMPEIDAKIEVSVNEEYKEKGIEWLQLAVKNEDAHFYFAGEIHNPARMLRALIFIRSTGKSILEFRSQTRKERNFEIIKIALTLPREILYQRINQRVDIMMKQGLEAEARQLFPSKNLKNLQTVGYSELFDFFEGKYSLNEAINKIKQHTRNYAKRQLTWFKKDDSYHWLNADGAQTISEILKLVED